MNPAAPLLFPLVPAKVLSDCTIVWISRSSWCGRRRGRRSGRRSGEWSRRKRRRSLRQSGGGASSANCHAAIIFLRLGPHVLDQLSIAHSIAHAQVPKACPSPAIVRQRSGRAGQEPEQKREQQQQTQQT